MSDDMKRELNVVKTRLDGVDSRLDGIDARLDGIDARLDGIDVRLDGIDVRLVGMDKKVTSGFGEVNAVIRSMAVAVSRLTERMESTATKSEMQNGFDAINRRLDDFSADIKLSRHERALQDKSFNFLKTHLEDHEARLLRIERKA
jgi:archaellum component FlaC